MSHDAAALLELGGVVLALALLTRVAGRAGIPAVPFYLLAGLAVGKGGVLPLETSRGFVETGAAIGLILLLFMLGLEYSASELLGGVRSSPLVGMVDLANGVPGFVVALVLGWGLVPAFLLGAVAYISSSGVIAKLLRDLGGQRSPESRPLLPLLLVEDLLMALFLPVASAMVVGGLTASAVAWAVVAVIAVGVVLAVAVRLEAPLSRLLRGRTDEALLLSILGFVLVVAGLAESLRVSAAVGALLAGIVLSGPVASNARVLLAPLRDLFAAMFFFFEGLVVSPSGLLPMLPAALALAAAGAITKFATGWWAGRRAGLGRDEAIGSGILLIPRGEFSVAIAALGAAVEPRLVPLAVSYVIVLAVVVPVLYRLHRPRERGQRSRLAPD
ncbi:MAG: cation:proton antiporter [Planctomycetaceae bacterium]